MSEQQNEQSDFREASWAVPEQVSERAEQEEAEAMSQAEEAGVAEDRHAMDERAGISPEQSDEMENAPAEIDRRSAAERFAPDPEQETGSSASARQPVEQSDAATKLYLEAQRQVVGGLDEYGAGQLDESIDELLVEADRDQDAAGIRKSIGESRGFYSITHPDYQSKMEGAQFLFSNERAEAYQAQGHSPEASMKQAVQDAELMVYKHASDAIAAGYDPAAYLDQVATQYLGTQHADKANPNPGQIYQQGMAAAKGAQQAADIQRGQRAAKTLGKGGFGNQRGHGDLTAEDIANITDPEEHERAYAQFTGENSDWRP